MSDLQYKLVPYWRSLALITVIFLGVISVLGSGGGDDDPGYVQYPLQDPTGVWYGHYTYWNDLIYSRISLMGVVWQGRWMLFHNNVDFDIWDRLYEGHPTVTQQFVAGDFITFDNHNIISIDYHEGYVYTKESISGSVNNPEYYFVGFSMSYSPLTEIGASLSITDSNWTEVLSDMTTTLSIDANGIITGSDTNGCIYNGTIEIPDTNKNIYKIVVNLANCGELNGSYSGLGFTSSSNNVFQLSISNSTHFINLMLNRV
jgi:hypothetical protein